MAKIAAKSKKPDGLVIVPAKDVAAYMRDLPVEKMQGVGIGARMALRFQELGIRTAGQLGGAQLGFLKAHFGILASVYKAMGQGVYGTEVKSYQYSEPVKSVGHSHTLPEDTFDLEVVRSYLMWLCEKTAMRMREYRVFGRTVSLYVRWSDFTGFGRQTTLQHFINDGAGICNAAWTVISQLLPLQKKVRLLGISVSNISFFEGQQSLFADTEKRRKLMTVMDQINNKYGDFTIKPTSVLIAENHGIQARCGIMGTRLWK